VTNLVRLEIDTRARRRRPREGRRGRDVTARVRELGIAAAGGEHGQGRWYRRRCRRVGGATSGLGSAADEYAGDEGGGQRSGGQEDGREEGRRAGDSGRRVGGPRPRWHRRPLRRRQLLRRRRGRARSGHAEAAAAAPAASSATPASSARRRLRAGGVGGVCGIWATASRRPGDGREEGTRRE
jgi:hypothetical protein